MRVIIRRKRRDSDWAELPERQWARGAALAFQASAAVSFAVCVWRWCVDLGFLGGSAAAADSTLLERWQIWLALAAALQLGASIFFRYSKSVRDSEAGARALLRSRLNRPAA